MTSWKPIYETLNLNKGDFLYQRSHTGTLPEGTAAEIVWANGVTWPASVAGNTVSWRVESEDCGPEVIPHGTRYDMLIRYPNPDTGTADDFHWKTGRAHRVPISE